MKNESGGKWVEHPQTIGWFFFWPFFYFLILKLYSFLIFYFPSFIFLFNWLLSKIESASSTHTMGWLLAFGPLGSTGQRKIGSHPARHTKLLRKRKMILYKLCNLIHFIKRLFLSDPCRGSDLETAFWLLVLLFLFLFFHLGLSS